MIFYRTSWITACDISSSRIPLMMRGPCRRPRRRALQLQPARKASIAYGASSLSSRSCLGWLRLLDFGPAQIEHRAQGYPDHRLFRARRVPRNIALDVLGKNGIRRACKAALVCAPHRIRRLLVRLRDRRQILGYSEYKAALPCIQRFRVVAVCDLCCGRGHDDRKRYGDREKHLRICVHRWLPDIFRQSGALVSGSPLG